MGYVVVAVIMAGYAVDLQTLVNLEDFAEHAKRFLPKSFYDFYSTGSFDQHTLRANREAFSEILIRPRALVDVSKIDTNVTFRLGNSLHTLCSPICIAPVSMQRLAHPEGEIAAVKGAVFA